MRAHLDRDSVAAGDDVDAHACVVDVAEGSDLDGLIAHVLRVYELPLIAGGNATWAVCSRRPLAVVAQQWSAPRMLPFRSLSDCVITGGAIQLYFSYFGQSDPDVVTDVLRRLRLVD